jgi:hypothetical protein
MMFAGGTVFLGAATLLSGGAILGLAVFAVGTILVVHSIAQAVDSCNRHKSSADGA